ARVEEKERPSDVTELRSRRPVGSPPVTTTDLDRAFGLQRWILETTSTRSSEMPWGTAFFQDDFPLKYDANLALFDRRLGAATAATVAEAMDELYGGFRHREIEVASAADGDRLSMGLVERDYGVESLLVMTQRRAPDRDPIADAAEEVDL